MNEEEEQLVEEVPAVEEVIEGVDLPDDEVVDEEEDEIVLTGQEPQDKPERTKSEHILNRVMKRDKKLQDENAALKQQLNKQAVAPAAPQVQARPDEYAYENRDDFLRADSEWMSQMLNGAVSGQLNQQQNGHRIAAQQQQQNEALTTYANNAAKLKVSNFNEVQDKAFDVLGDDFAKLIAEQLPEDAPKLMYHFGRNPQEAIRIREEYETNPGRTTFSLGKLAANLVVKKRQSKAASPEAKPENGSVGGMIDSLDKQMAKLDKDLEAGTITINECLNARRKIKAEHRKAS